MVDTSTLAGIRKASKKPSTYRPPGPAALEQQRSGGSAGRSSMGASGPASGSTAAYNKMGADLAFNRVNDWRLGRYLAGDPQFQPKQPAPAPMMGGGGGGRSGGGGGGIPGAENFDAYAAQMMKLIGSMKPVTNPLAGSYNGAVDRDIAEARAAYGGLAKAVPMNDPYLAMVAQSAPTVNPGMEAFLSGQGMGTGDYDSAVAQQNAELRAGADNWSNYARAAGANHVAGQRGIVDTAKLQGQNIVQGFEGQRNELAAMVAAQQAAEQQRVQQERIAAIMQLLSMGMQYGKAPDIGGLL